MVPSWFRYSRLLPFILLATSPVAAQVFGPNLIANSGAEAGTGSANDTQVGSVPSWTNSGANVITYASGYGLAPDSILPPNVGKNYFSSGKTNSTLTQTVNLASGATDIDTGNVVYTVSGYFGGYQDRDDYASLTVTYLGASNNSLNTVTIGSVKSADRAGSGLYFRRQIGLVPLGARSATVILSFTLAVAGSNNNAYADNVSLILNTPAAPSTFLGRNLIVNGDAEQSLPLPPNSELAPDIPGWVRSASFTTDTYVGEISLRPSDPGPPDRGTYYFLGGPDNAASYAYQDIDISPLSTQVDSGGVKFAFGAWIGGYSDQEDNAVLTTTFRNGAGGTLSMSQLGPVTAADRKNISAILQRSSNGTVPIGARQIRVRMDMTRATGLYNDGLADSLTLVLTASGGVPTISSGGVATAAAYGGSQAIAPGTWIEIYGQNLATGAAREWAGPDFSGSTAPTTLDGVKVSVGGQSAFVRYISPGQVNVQVPSGVGTGQQSLVVTTSAGGSAGYPITVNATQPGFLAPGSFLVSGKQYVAGLFADGATFTIPASTISGVASRAAKPGETIILYGVGFGPTSPNIVAGQIVGQANSLANPLQIQIGGVTAQTVYAGLAPNFVGLYQFNVTIPNVPIGDAVPLTATLGGTAIPQTLYIAIGR